MEIPELGPSTAKIRRLAHSTATGRSAPDYWGLLPTAPETEWESVRVPECTGRQVEKRTRRTFCRSTGAKSGRPAGLWYSDERIALHRSPRLGEGRGAYWRATGRLCLRQKTPGRGEPAKANLQNKTSTQVMNES